MADRTCCECGESFSHPPRKGRPPTRCQACRTALATKAAIARWEQERPPLKPPACLDCGATQADAEFQKDKSRRNGFVNRCKPCQQERDRAKYRKKHYGGKPTLDPRRCIGCLAEFQPTNRGHRWCQPKCRARHKNAGRSGKHRLLRIDRCEWCDKEFEVRSDNPDAKGCSVACGMMIAGRFTTSCEIKWVHCKCGEWKTTRSEHDCGYIYIEPVPIAICQVCDKVVVVKSHGGAFRYCSRLCKDIAYTGTYRNIWVRDCGWCDTTYVSRIERGVYCSKRCSRHARRYDEGRFAIPDPIRYAIYERDGWRCQLCRKKVNPKLSPNADWAASLDHIVPQSHGGQHTPDNLQLAHRMCNSMKCNGVYGNGEQPSLLALDSLTP